MSTSNNNNNNSKKKRKRSSPFRIKVGCLVALRYRAGGNQIQLEMDGDEKNPLMEQQQQQLDQNDDDSNMDNNNNNDIISAQFSEVWTDPLPGHDDGLALIGSRIRCFFPKIVLLEPYNATSRLLEGEVVNVVLDGGVEDAEKETKEHFRGLPNATGEGLWIDLLIDNKNDKQLKALPFLERIDLPPPPEKELSASEKRSLKNEERIKGGAHKAIVRVLLSDASEMVFDKKVSSATKEKNGLLEAKWVIRKRVPAKIIRKVGKNISKTKTKATPTTISVGENGQDKGIRESDVLSNNGADADMNSNEDNAALNGEVNETNKKNGSDKVKESNTHNDNDGDGPPKKRRKVFTTNKDFSIPRYLGDGNDPPSQQEANWRWQAAIYNPCSVLADRPISKDLLERLAYNFVGEVIRIQPETSPNASTLAMVTIKRLVLPEHTVNGRLLHHGPYDIFEDDDLKLSSLFAGMRDTEQGEQNNDHACLLRVPIEELVIVHRKVLRYPDSHENVSRSSLQQPTEMTIRHSYSFQNDAFRPLEPSKTAESDAASNDACRSSAEKKICGRCRHYSAVAKRLAGVFHLLCVPCTGFLRKAAIARGTANSKGKNICCDCVGCASRVGVGLQSDLSHEVMESISKIGSTLQELENYSTHEDSGFITTRFVVKGMYPVDFGFCPSSFLDPFTDSSSSKPITKVKARVPKRTKKALAINSGVMDASIKDGGRSPMRQSMLDPSKKIIVPLTPRKEVFRPTSSRLLPYNPSKRKFDVSATELYQWKMVQTFSPSIVYPERPRNLRLLKNAITDTSGDDAAGKKKTLGRAARANQRRFVRSVAAMGVTVDTLAGREQQLRFDRSGIHDWGVFVDIDIREGDMIVEYRGEIIGNAMAEKREKEYEAAKIGSDYMFRIDDLTVCDATKQGNVARFINASCEPNCYTKIISLDGSKRIVIYAKRDIKAGEELCYDYKFPLEYDPDQRIPCRCGARECRGYLNWDQRYAEVQATEDGVVGYDGNGSNSRMKGTDGQA